jgi:hypothetical protein
MPDTVFELCGCLIDPRILASLFWIETGRLITATFSAACVSMAAYRQHRSTDGYMINCACSQIHEPNTSALYHVTPRTSSTPVVTTTDRYTFCLINDTVSYSHLMYAKESGHRLLQTRTAGFENLTAVSMKMAVFWDVAPCSVVEVYQRFRGPCCLHHHGDE